MGLPGIGAELARRIVIYRKGHRFGAIEELLEVDGIGPGRYRRLRPLVRVE